MQIETKRDQAVQLLMEASEHFAEVGQTDRSARYFQAALALKMDPEGEVKPFYRLNLNPSAPPPPRPPLRAAQPRPLRRLFPWLRRRS